MLSVASQPRQDCHPVQELVPFMPMLASRYVSNILNAVISMSMVMFILVLELATRPHTALGVVHA